MVGISYRYHAEACIFRLFNGKFHGLNTKKLSHGIMSFHHSRKRRFKNDLRNGINLYHSFCNFLMIADEALNPVRFYSAKIRIQQNICDLSALFIGKSVALKHLLAESRQPVIGNMMILHRESPLFWNLSRMFAV